MKEKLDNINKYNLLFIDKIKNKIQGSIIETLEDILPLSREAIYRRLRGAVIFSYPEVIMIAQKLDISLDDITQKDSDYFLFRIDNTIASNSTEESYIDYLTHGVSNLDEFIQEGSALYYTTTQIPMALTQNYECLIKYRYFKWLHENRRLEFSNRKLSEIEISKNTYNASASFFTRFRQIESTFMFPESMIENYLKEVKHFIDLDLINQEDAKEINGSLHDLINEFEKMVATGRYKNGANVSIYLTDINLDSNFGYLDYGKQHYTFSKIFGMRYASCQSETVYLMYKNAFEDLKDYATLISQSGSAKRTVFFKDQHKIVDQFLDVKN